MILKILLPTHELLEESATKIIAEAPNGSFCLLPKHVDFVASLVPGLLSYVSESGTEKFVAVDEGVLVKCGDEVLVSTRQAVLGTDLGMLQRMVVEQFENLDDRERTARSAAARLEADFARRFLALGDTPHV